MRKSSESGRTIALDGSRRLNPSQASHSHGERTTPSRRGLKRRCAVGEARATLAGRSVQIDRSRGRLDSGRLPTNCISTMTSIPADPPSRNAASTHHIETIALPPVLATSVPQAPGRHRVPAALSDPCDVAAGSALLLTMCYAPTKKKSPASTGLLVGRTPDRASSASKRFPLRRLRYCDAAYCCWRKTAALRQRADPAASVLVRQNDARMSRSSRLLLGQRRGHAHQCRDQHSL